MNNLLTAIEFALAGAQVLRYHTSMSLRDETVGHHSHGVATLIVLLNPLASKELIVSALYHDLEEHVTGDLPSTVKRDLDIRDLLQDYGDKIKHKAGIVMPALSFEEEVRLKFADAAHGALNCLYEMKGGNRHRYAILSRYIDFMQELQPELLESELTLFNMIRKRTQEYMILKTIDERT